MNGEQCYENCALRGVGVDLLTDIPPGTEVTLHYEGSIDGEDTSNDESIRIPPSGIISFLFPMDKLPKKYDLTLWIKKDGEIATNKIHIVSVSSEEAPRGLTYGTLTEYSLDILYLRADHHALKGTWTKRSFYMVYSRGHIDDKPFSNTANITGVMECVHTGLKIGDGKPHDKWVLESVAEDITSKPRCRCSALSMTAEKLVAPPPIETGTLSVDTTPVKGEVFVNDISWGIAPQEKTIDIGDYTVSFGEISGYITPPSQEVTIVKDQLTEIEGKYIKVPPEVEKPLLCLPSIWKFPEICLYKPFKFPISIR